MQFRLYTLSITLLALVSFAGCWRKKCCSKNHEESPVEHVHQHESCNTCPDLNDNDNNDEEFPAASEKHEGRVSGPRGWDKEVLK